MRPIFLKDDTPYYIGMTIMDENCTVYRIDDYDEDRHTCLLMRIPDYRRITVMDETVKDMYIIAGD